MFDVALGLVLWVFGFVLGFVLGLCFDNCVGHLGLDSFGCGVIPVAISWRW